MKISLPHIIIVGRPNVGKSTLFNRLLKKRQAITSHVPGVTRDLLQNIFTLPNQTSCILEDSAGHHIGSHNEIEKMADQRTLEALHTADLILLVTEVNTLTHDDYSLIEHIRKTELPTLLIVNKCDVSSLEYSAVDLWKIGLGQPFAISAEHNRNITEIVGKIQEILAPHPDLREERQKNLEILIKISVLGRPNAGKSTLVNALCQNEKHLTSPIPGTTRDIVSSFFEDNGDNFEIVDTAGLRRASKIGESLEFYASTRVEKAIELCDVALLLIDITQGLTDQDKKIASKVISQKKPLLLTLTKSDLKEKPKTEVKEHGYFNDILREEIDKVRSAFPVLSYAPIVTISSQSPGSLKTLLKKLRGLHQEAGRKTENVDLNNALLRWCAYRLPRSKKSRSQVWLKDLRQIGSYPPRFVLRVRGDLSKDYLRYVANNLRKEFRFFHVPINIKVVHES